MLKKCAVDVQCSQIYMNRECQQSKTFHIPGRRNNNARTAIKSGTDAACIHIPPVYTQQRWQYEMRCMQFSCMTVRAHHRSLCDAYSYPPIHFHSDARESRVGFRGRKSKAGNGRTAFSTVSVGNVAAAARGRGGLVQCEGWGTQALAQGLNLPTSSHLEYLVHTG